MIQGKRSPQIGAKEAAQGSRGGKHLPGPIKATLIIAIGLSAAAQATSAGERYKPERPSADAIPILVYHRITEEGGKADEERVPIDTFRKQMEYLKMNGYRTVSLEELESLGENTQKRTQKLIAIHFDDGWKSVEQAIPVLQSLGMKASFMVITGAADGQYGDEYLNWTEIKRIDKDLLFDIGSHTVSHPWKEESNLVLWTMHKDNKDSEELISRELEGSKQVLESRLGHPVQTLAWPKGWYNHELNKRAIKAGYKLMLSYQCTGKVTQLSGGLLRDRCGVDGRIPTSVFRLVLKKGNNQ